MSTHIRLADLTDKALALLKAQGLSASTIGGYTKKYEFLKKYFASHNTAYGSDSNRRLTVLQTVLFNRLSTVSWLG